MPEPVRVLLVDDHLVVRQGLRAFLQLQPDIEVVGEVGGGTAAVAAATDARPDVVLMDLVMPDGDGIGAIRALAAAAPGTRVLVLSSFADDERVFAAMQAGAAGYLLKDVEPDALAEAIREVHRGRPALHPDVAALLMRRVADHGEAGGAGLEPLTPREREVLQLVVEGFANKQIARRLRITEKTVKTHVSSILQKLGVPDRTAAAVLALRQGLVR
ncbi:MAG TPA: response regulator transcription factor [Candidatus Dormibacteraeota bacterium]|nr:response regulator transcription factor [Candidatus Dormibacteraeota bacterium]